MAATMNCVRKRAEALKRRRGLDGAGQLLLTAASSLLWRTIRFRDLILRWTASDVILNGGCFRAGTAANVTCH